jgi:hypothetical protein
VPAHLNAADDGDAYLEEAAIAAKRKSPLFRSVDRSGKSTDRPLDARNALDTFKRRANRERDAIHPTSYSSPDGPYIPGTGTSFNRR